MGEGLVVSGSAQWLRVKILILCTYYLVLFLQNTVSRKIIRSKFYSFETGGILTIFYIFENPL